MAKSLVPTLAAIPGPLHAEPDALVWVDSGQNVEYHSWLNFKHGLSMLASTAHLILIDDQRHIIQPDFNAGIGIAIGCHDVNDNFFAPIGRQQRT